MKLENIQEAIKVAMKAHSTIEVETLRGIVAAIKKAAIDKRCEITDELVDETLLKEKKIIQEMIDTCPVYRTELAEKYAIKMNIINNFAPQIVSDPAEIRSMVMSVLAEAGVDWQTANKGQVMKVVMPQAKGKYDMGVVNKVITELMK